MRLKNENYTTKGGWKTVIDNVTYNTDTAICVGMCSKYYEEESVYVCESQRVYQKRNQEYFFHTTTFVLLKSDKSCYDTIESIMPIDSEEEVDKWFEQRKNYGSLKTKKVFDDELEKIIKGV